MSLLLLLNGDPDAPPPPPPPDPPPPPPTPAVTYAPPHLVLPGGIRLEVVPQDDRESWYQLHLLEGLDGPGIRDSASPWPDGDGEVLGPTQLEARLWPIEVTIVARNRLDLAQREAALRHAFRRTNELWELRIVNRIPGGPDLISMVRPSQPWRHKAREGWGRRLSDGQVVLKAPDPILLDPQWQAGVIYPPQVEGGIEWPIEWPIDWGGSAYLGTPIVTAGDAMTWPQLTIHGPITDPVISNITTGQAIVLSGSILVDQTLVIDPRRRTVLLNGDPGQSRYHWSDGALTTWWALAPGSNAIGLLGTATDTTTRLGVLWRDGYL